MKKLLALALLIPALTACTGGSRLPTDFSVSGTLSGTPPNSPVKMAFIGASMGGVVNENSPQIAVQLGDKGVFALDYPADPAEGYYKVIAYVDSNGDNKYNLGEKLTYNDKALVYRKSDLGSFKTGWNLMQGTTVTQPGKVTGYDLSW